MTDTIDRRNGRVVYTGCKHLDYDGDYKDATLTVLDADRGWHCWIRDRDAYPTGAHPAEATLKMQVCKTIGRIAGMAPGCIAGTERCYEAQESEVPDA